VYWGFPFYWPASWYWGWGYPYNSYPYYDYYAPYGYPAPAYPAAPAYPSGEVAPAPSTEVPLGPGSPTQGPLYMNYCESSKAYFPKVESCPEGWRFIAPQQR
jgi:hypothetical protein